MDASTVTGSMAARCSGERAQTPIDRVHLARYTFGSLPLELEVLGLFADQAPKTLGELAGAPTDKAWRDAAHTLKGSARAVGAWRIAEVAERAEALETIVDHRARARAVATLAEALDEAIRYIGSLSGPGRPEAA